MIPTLRSTPEPKTLEYRSQSERHPEPWPQTLDTLSGTLDPRPQIIQASGSWRLL